jgi:hypothetical protein
LTSSNGATKTMPTTDRIETPGVRAHYFAQDYLV